MFYAYVYRDPRPTKNLQPVYVGKGQDRRAWRHWEKQVKNNKGFGNFLALLRREGLEPVIELVKEGLDEAEAFYEEVRLIAEYGRRDLKTGPLFNLTAGGEGMVGAIRTPEWRANIKAALTTPEQRRRNAEVQKTLWSDPAYRERTTTAIREALKDPEVIARREAGKEAFVHTPEFAQTMREASIKMWTATTYREKTVASMKAAGATPEGFAKKAAATAAGWANEATRARRIASIKASRTPELRAQIGASCKALWDDAKRLEQSEKMRRVLDTPELRAKQASATRARWADPAKYPRKNMRAVVATSPIGEEYEFRSANILIPELGMSDGAICSALRTGAPLKKGKFKGWSVKYKNPLDTTKP